MKKLLVLLVIAVLAAPGAAFADAKIDSDVKIDSSARIDSDVKVGSNAKLDYNVKCAKCHRETKLLPKTAKQLEVDPGKLTLRTSKMNRDEMIAIVEKGRDKMPGFEKELTKEQISEVVDYIIFLKKRTKVRNVAPTRLY